MEEEDFNEAWDQLDEVWQCAMSARDKADEACISGTSHLPRELNGRLNDALVDVQLAYDYLLRACGEIEVLTNDLLKMSPDHDEDDE